MESTCIGRTNQDLWPDDILRVYADHGAVALSLTCGALSLYRPMTPAQAIDLARALVQYADAVEGIAA
jgi:hypothetical protein